ncbi:hypothetical protein D3C87_2133210 [compost metagenome]
MDSKDIIRFLIRYNLHEAVRLSVHQCFTDRCKRNPSHDDVMPRILGLLLGLPQ